MSRYETWLHLNILQLLMWSSSWLVGWCAAWMVCSVSWQWGDGSVCSLSQIVHWRIWILCQFVVCCTAHIQSWSTPQNEGQLIVSNYVAVSINNWLQDVSATYIGLRQLRTKLVYSCQRPSAAALDQQHSEVTEQALVRDWLATPETLTAVKGLCGHSVLQSVVNWYCYVIARNQLAYIEECSSDPLQHYCHRMSL